MKILEEISKKKLKEEKIRREISPKSIFIIGPARSGTTVVCQSLNSHADIHITAEANFSFSHQNHFAEAFSIRHKHQGKTASKITYTPNFLGKRYNYWYDYLIEMSYHYDWVGDKIALSADNPLLYAKIIQFHSRFFYKSKYIFVFRKPTESIISAQKLLGHSNLLVYAYAWLLTLKLWCKMVRIFPHVVTIFHHQLDKTFSKKINDLLNIKSYDFTKIISPTGAHPHLLNEVSETYWDNLNELDKLFNLVSAMVDSERFQYVNIMDIYSMKQPEFLKCQAFFDKIESPADHLEAFPFDFLEKQCDHLIDTMVALLKKPKLSQSEKDFFINE